MADWEHEFAEMDEDEQFIDPDEEEFGDMLVDYCADCGSPILEGDLYVYTDDGEILCEDCRNLHEVEN